MGNKNYRSTVYKRAIDVGKITTPLADDLVKIWRDAEGDEKSISLADLAVGVITAGVHNSLTGLQGGSTTERYHLTAAQQTALHSAVTIGTPAGGLSIDGNQVLTLTGQVPIRQVFVYSTTNIFSLSYSAPTAIYVALNGQVLEQGSSYDWTISGASLTVTTPLRAGDEISILYYTSLPSVTNYGRNIDGGAPDSVYLAIQNVNGGTP